MLGQERVDKECLWTPTKDSQQLKKYDVHECQRESNQEFQLPHHERVHRWSLQNVSFCRSHELAFSITRGRNRMTAKQNASAKTIHVNREKAMAVASILKALKKKVDGMQSACPSTMEFGDSEKQIMKKLNGMLVSALIKGCTMGLASFVLLRRMRWNVTNHHSKKITTVGTDCASRVSNSPFHRHPSQLHRALSSSASYGIFAAMSSHAYKILQKSSCANVFGVLLDGVVSFLIAVMASIQFTDVRVILFEFSRIPLLREPSVIAREFCPILLEELKLLEFRGKSDGGDTSDEWKKHAASVYFDAFVEFGQHCNSRDHYERCLRLERNVGLHEQTCQTTDVLHSVFGCEWDWGNEDWAQAMTADKEDDGSG